MLHVLAPWTAPIQELAMVFAFFRFPVLLLKRCVARMLCKNFPARKFSKHALRTTRLRRNSVNPGTCHDFCLFSLPRLALETLRGAYALQKFSREKVFQTRPSNNEVPTKQRESRNLPWFLPVFASPSCSWNHGPRPTCLILPIYMYVVIYLFSYTYA